MKKSCFMLSQITLIYPIGSDFWNTLYSVIYKADISCVNISSRSGLDNDLVYLIQRLLFCVCLAWSPGIVACLQRQIEVTTVLEKLREVMSAVVRQEWSAASMTALLQLVSTLQSILSVSQSFSSLQALLVEARFLDALLNVLEQSVVSCISVIREPTNFFKPFENVFMFVQKRSLHF